MKEIFLLSNKVRYVRQYLSKILFQAIRLTVHLYIWDRIGDSVDLPVIKPGPEYHNFAARSILVRHRIGQQSYFYWVLAEPRNVFRSAASFSLPESNPGLNGRVHNSVFWWLFSDKKYRLCRIQIPFLSVNLRLWWLLESLWEINRHPSSR